MKWGVVGVLFGLVITAASFQADCNTFCNDSECRTICVKPSPGDHQSKFIPRWITETHRCQNAWSQFLSSRRRIRDLFSSSANSKNRRRASKLNPSSNNEDKDQESSGGIRPLSASQTGREEPTVSRSPNRKKKPQAGKVCGGKLRKKHKYAMW